MKALSTSRNSSERLVWRRPTESFRDATQYLSLGKPVKDADVPKRRARLSDVAESAGVSAVTVSRVIRHPEMVSAALRQRVESAVRDLHYIPNHLASALASTRTGIVGVVVPSLTNGVFVDYLSAIEGVLIARGFQVTVLNVHYSGEEEERAIGTLLGYHPEALIVAGVDQTERSRQLLRRAGIPVVQTMELEADPVDINIGLDQGHAGYRAARYLLDLGHRAVGILTAQLDPRAIRRQEGYQRAMTEAGIDTAGLVVGSPRFSTFKLGGELLSELLDKRPDIEAVCCCNDDLALGALFECQRRGIRVPDDLSILGFNDLDFCALANPTLSSISTPRREMGRRAAETIVEIIRGDGNRPPQSTIDLGFEIVARASTRAAGPAL